MPTEMINQSISHAAVNTGAWCIKKKHVYRVLQKQNRHILKITFHSFFLLLLFVHQHTSAQSLDLLSFSHKKTGGHDGSSVCPRWPHRDEDEVIHVRFSLTSGPCWCSVKASVLFFFWHKTATLTSRKDQNIKCEHFHYFTQFSMNNFLMGHEAVNLHLWM